jgi:hypothetical protein
MSKSVENTALTERTETTGELATTSAAALAQHEIQSAIIVARRFPRSEDQAFAKLMKSCQRTSFAEDAEYSFPRGGQNVTGPSVNVAREAARVWGNLRYGLYVTRDDAESRQVRGWAWDLETNTKIEMEDDFAKLVYRKKGGWVTPDERDLRELTNRRGAILVRNCLLQLLPKDLIEDALRACRETIEKGVAQDPDGARKKLILAFGQLNVTPEMLEGFLGHKLSESTPAEISELRTIFTSIRDGNSKWHEYVDAKQPEGAGAEKPAASKGTLRMEDLQAPPKPDDGDQPINEDQYTVLLDTVASAGVSLTDVFEYVKEKYGVARVTVLPRKHYPATLEWIAQNRKAKTS